MSDLKPCPFCGGTNIEINGISKGCPWILEGLVAVGSTDCGLWNQTFDKGQESEAAEGWNRRADNDDG